jgi:hypothetical protein
MEKNLKELTRDITTKTAQLTALQEDLKQATELNNQILH